jgi:hypothetical protein
MSANQPATTGIAPSFTWGASAKLLTTQALVGKSVSTQLAQVSLPEPAVCSLYFQTTITRASEFASVKVFTLNLVQGVGRVAVPRQISFVAQPSLHSPIEFTIPFVPLHALQVNIEQICDFVGIGNDELETETYLVLAPITRIDDKHQKIRFGMAMPGEADEMDDELRAELEGEAPTVVEVMEADHSGANDEVDDVDDEPPQGTTQAGSIVAQIIAELTRKLGRPPKRHEAQAAVQRVQARLARRGAR